MEKYVFTKEELMELLMRTFREGAGAEAAQEAGLEGFDAKGSVLWIISSLKKEKI
jgi:hypothetical protein